MLRHKNTDRICCMVLACTLLLTCLYMSAAAGGLITGASAMGYENRLFDPSRVHTIDIVIDDWEGFLETCTDEEYVSCSVVIDGEAYADVGIRAKGNTSLSSVASYGNDRYSFKLEFDQYQTGRTYYGLDKISLNNLIQDKTYMKDYLAYTLMNKMGVAAPLCSFVQINVNGEAWGLYLAVEAVEDGFLERNYGSDHGELYKPDSLSFGGGRGNGRNFDMSEFSEQLEQLSEMDEEELTSLFEQFTDSMGFDFPGGTFENGSAQFPFQPSASSAPLDNLEEEGVSSADAASDRRGSFSRGGRGSSDVKLQYIDDSPDSYSNIFSSAKTDVTEEDQVRLIESLKTLSESENIESAVDTEAVIRYLVVHNFMCNGDSYTGSMIHNYYLYEENGQLSMLPWDYNLAFGAFNMGSMSGSNGATDTVNSPIDSPVSSGDISDRPILSWIFESEEYTALYHEIYSEFIALAYDGGWLDEEIARVSEMITPYVEQDATAFFTYDEFTTAIETLREFCSLRCASIAGQLEGIIPSTTEAQRVSSASLIDASHISLSDMGEFSMGGRGGMTMPNASTMPGSMNRPQSNAADPPEAVGEQNGTVSARASSRGGISMPDDFSFNPSSADTSSGQWTYLAVCTVLLIAAIVIVRFAKSGR